MNNYFLRDRVDPQFDGIKKNFQIIEKKIKDFQEKSSFRGKSEIFSIDEEYYPTHHKVSSVISEKENSEKEKYLKILKDVKKQYFFPFKFILKEYDTKISQLTREYEKQMNILKNDYEKEIRNFKEKV